MSGILTSANWRSLLPGQESELCEIDVETGEVDVLHRSAEQVIEAPNWSPDGEWIVYNSGGGLFRLRLSDRVVERIETGELDDHNNDHVFSPDGATIYTSSEVSGHLFAVPFDGGVPRRLTREQDRPFGYFLQGISPDGVTLSFTGADVRPGRPFANDLYTLPAEGGTEHRLTEWDVDAIGCDYAPDGRWLYFNAALDARREGHMQLYRMRPDATAVERLTEAETSDWFPRASPSGDWVAFLSFPPGTIGHEANVPVVLKRMRPDGSEQHELARFLGGQGTMNVNSWAPDGRRFAFVRYPIAEKQQEKK
ncbi:TolB family protein [Leifsonia sp. NPDC058230]|uniref:TolB family protein n=1 Tax=Leifsonia sp. NPDC058230 TaxID=3346391 RepID=UPI0036DDA4C4